jgi:hypothetical protein
VEVVYRRSDDRQAPLNEKVGKLVSKDRLSSSIHAVNSYARCLASSWPGNPIGHSDQDLPTLG